MYNWDMGLYYCSSTTVSLLSLWNHIYIHITLYIITILKGDDSTKPPKQILQKSICLSHPLSPSDFPMGLRPPALSRHPRPRTAAHALAPRFGWSPTGRGGSKPRSGFEANSPRSMENLLEIMGNHKTTMEWTNWRIVIMADGIYNHTYHVLGKVNS